MTLLFGADSERPAALVDAELAMRTPLGAVSPLWGIYAAAASAGLAYWWMTRWMRPLNLEAMMGVSPALPERAEAPAMPLGGESGPIQSPAGALAAVAEPMEAVTEAIAEVFAAETPPKIETPAEAKAAPARPRAPSASRKI